MVTARIPIDIVWGGAAGSPGVNVWHGRFDSGEPGSGDLEGLTDILQAFYTTLRIHFPSPVTIQWNGEATGVGADAEQTFTSDPWSITGENASGFLPMATTQYVNWRSASGGRSGRGRTFLGPIAVNQSEGDGTPTLESQQRLQGAVNALVSASLSDLNGALGVWSRQDSLLRDFTSGNTPNKFGVLRSRRD